MTVIKKAIKVLSFGGGQDSHAILYRLVFDEIFRAMHMVGKDLVVVMSDTGNEHPHTYQAIADVQVFCSQYAIPFFFLTQDLGFHTDAWMSLEERMRSNDSIIMCGGPKACTDKLKIQPVYKFLDKYIGERYGWKSGRKSALKRYAEEFGRLEVMVGFAKGEESRVPSAQAVEAREKRDPWWKAVSVVYPLIESGMDRQACINYIKSVGMNPVFPSNCMMCPFLDKGRELLWLHRFHPEVLARWIQLEANKIKTHGPKCEAEGKANNGVFGTKKTLGEYLEKAIQDWGHLTNEELNEFKFSHGHCIKSKY